MDIPSITSIPNTVLIVHNFLNFGFCTKKKDLECSNVRHILVAMQLLDIKLYWILKIMVYLWCKPQ